MDVQLPHPSNSEHVAASGSRASIRDIHLCKINRGKLGRIAGSLFLQSLKFDRTKLECLYRINVLDCTHVPCFYKRNDAVSSIEKESLGVSVFIKDVDVSPM